MSLICGVRQILRVPNELPHDAVPFSEWVYPRKVPVVTVNQIARRRRKVLVVLARLKLSGQSVRSQKMDLMPPECEFMCKVH